MATLPADARADFQNRPVSRLEERPEEGARLSRLRLAGFASIAVPIYGAALPLVMFVPQLYAAEYGLSLATIGLIFFVGRFWDVAIDPLIGALSDRTRSHFGRRRPWIAAGGLVFGLSSALLFFPSPALVTPAYLATVLFLFYVGWSMVEIPFSARTGELSASYHGRTRVVGYQLTSRALGVLAVLVLPTILEQFDPSNGVLKLNLVGGFILATLLPSLIVHLLVLPEAPASEAPALRQGIAHTAGIIFSDRLLLRVLASDIMVTTGQSFRAGLIVFFVVWYMGLPAWASGLYLLQFIFGVAAAPIWQRIGGRIGKREAAIAGELTQAAINLALLFVFPGGLPLLVILTIAQGLTQGSGNLMLRAMVADVADAQRLRTGQDRTGLLFSVFALSEKLGPAIGIGIAMSLVGWAGFTPGPNNSSQALEMLKYVFALGPALAHIAATLIIWRFPLGEAAHADIRRALEQRDALPA